MIVNIMGTKWTVPLQQYCLLSSLQIYQISNCNRQLMYCPLLDWCDEVLTQIGYAIGLPFHMFQIIT